MPQLAISKKPPSLHFKERAHGERAIYTSLSVTPISPTIGAEIGDIDLTRPLSDLQVKELHQAFTEYLVLFFRDQKVSWDDQARLANYFGPLGDHVGVTTNSLTTEHPQVRKFHYDEHSERISGENWHSDQSCAQIPPLGSMLYNHTIPPDGGGDTMFGNMYEAYEALTPRMKTYLAGLTATHDGTRIFGAGSPVAVHPVITRHAVSGRKVIYVNAAFTAKINEVPRLESEHIIRFLLDHCARAEWTCRFRWRAHSIAFWDNRCAQHKAIWDYWPHTRSGYRVQIEGTTAPVAG
ncbi:MAG: TauD/TfdA dioxygenase family protein [Burkholderiales bacterium]